MSTKLKYGLLSTIVLMLSIFIIILFNQKIPCDNEYIVTDITSVIQSEFDNKISILYPVYKNENVNLTNIKDITNKSWYENPVRMCSVNINIINRVFPIEYSIDGNYKSYKFTLYGLYEKDKENFNK